MFYSDKPIQLSQEDQLGRNSFAKLLAQSLLHLNILDTFTIGLFGKWGSGKTSIVNLTLREIEEQQKDLCTENKLIIVHFEPWNFSEENQLLNQFFIRMSNEFRNKGDKNLESIGNALEQYSDAFGLLGSLSPALGLLGFLGKRGTVALGKRLKNGAGEKDILKQKEFIIKLLEKQSNRILVVIDDIDRLSNAQIRQVFQLITSVAKFPNTMYLLVFDKDIVVKALENVQEGSGEDYLEKIIQMPIQIPEIQHTKIRQVLLQRLNEILAEHTDVNFHETHWQQLYEPCIASLINNLRDINRLCNAVQFKLASIASEVDFTDLVAISALEIHFPKIYEWVKNNKPILTGELYPGYLMDQNKNQKELYADYSSRFKILLEGNHANPIVDEQVEIVIEFLSLLFPHFGRKIGKTYEIFGLDLLRRNNQIAHAEKFFRYFSLDLDGVVFKKSQILNAIYTNTGPELEQLLLDQEKNGSSYEFLEEIRAMASEIPSDRVKLIIEVLLKTSSELNTRSTHNMLLPASYLAERMVIELLDTVAHAERFPLISNFITNSDVDTIQSAADIVNQLELAYGRLAAKGERREIKRVITLDELIRLESVFTKKVKQLLNEHNLFDFNRWRIVYYLLESFDTDYAKSYMKIVLKDDSNIAKYLVSSVSAWISGRVEYEVENTYQEYLTKERILQAIDSLKKSGLLFILSEEIQHKCGAFFLYAIKKNHYDDHIPQSDVDELLASWRG